MLLPSLGRSVSWLCALQPSFMGTSFSFIPFLFFSGGTFSFEIFKLKKLIHLKQVYFSRGGYHCSIFGHCLKIPLTLYYNKQIEQIKDTLHCQMVFLPRVTCIFSVEKVVGVFVSCCAFFSASCFIVFEVSLWWPVGVRFFHMEVFLQLLIILLFQKKEDFKCDLQLSLVLLAESWSNSRRRCRNVSWLIVHTQRGGDVHILLIKLDTFFKNLFKISVEEDSFVF